MPGLFVLRTSGWEVSYADRDYRSQTRKDLAGIRTFLRCPFQPGHGSVVVPLPEPLRQAVIETPEKW